MTEPFPCLTQSNHRFHSLSSESGTVAAVRPYSLLIWFLLPTLSFIWLWFLPPHALDIAIAKTFFNNGQWWGSTQIWIEPLLHKLPKYISIGVALLCAVQIVRLNIQSNCSNRSIQQKREQIRRLLYLLTSMGACVLIVYLLKTSTGVACPASTFEFGGIEKIHSAANGFVFGNIPGNCWPSGAAGSGFCLFGLYFYFRDQSQTAARLTLIAAIVLGCLAGFGRMSSGMHFASHVAASFCLDWIISAALYLAYFSRRNLIDRLLIELKGKKALETSAQRLEPGSPLVSKTCGILFTALWWTLVFDSPMFARLMNLPEAVTWSKVGLFISSATCFGLLAVALIELFSWLPKRIFHTIMTFLSVLGAAGFTGAYLYGIVFTPDMIRNFLATDAHEAMGYFSVKTLFVFGCAWLPLFWISINISLQQTSGITSLSSLFSRKIWGSILRRLTLFLGLIIAALAVLLINFQSFSGAMRADKSLRYQIVPAVIVYSLIKTLTADANPDHNRARTIIDANPQRQIIPARATLFVVVVGETTRSASWQLAGYPRQTNPKLAQHDVISFSAVEACGTSTDVSLPCMMSRIGRSDYDRKRILSEEALPAVLQRAGFEVLWVDNQSGCKGVCAGVSSRGPSEQLKQTSSSCKDSACFDGVLVEEVETILKNLKKGQSQVLFLHMMGSHGPAYHKRTPQDQKTWLPECTANDLGSCSKQEIENAYDNSVRYTDSVLGDILSQLEQAHDVNTAMVYVSDHGESLGEKGLYLHGAPYWLAPKEQLTVPMVIWLSNNFAHDYQVERRHLVSHVNTKVTHENLYHTILGLLQVFSTTKRDQFDLTRSQQRD